MHDDGGGGGSGGGAASIKATIRVRSPLPLVDAARLRFVRARDDDDDNDDDNDDDDDSRLCPCEQGSERAAVYSRQASGEADVGRVGAR